MDDATIETKSAVEHTAAAGQHAYKETVAQAAQAGQAAFKDTMEKSLTAINELNSQAKRNVEAVVASVTAATHGAEALSTQAMAFTKKSVEGQVEHSKALSSARSMQELIELQTSYAKAAFETYVSEMTHAAETFSTVMKDSLRPLNERATALAETLQSQR